MTMKLRAFVLCLGLLAVSQFNCVAKELTSAEQGDLALEVFQMSQSLDSLTEQLRAQQSANDEYQKLQAAISYLSFRSRSIEMLKYELRFKKERRDSYIARIERIEEDPEAWDKIDKSFQSKNPSPTSSSQRPSELRLKILKDGLEEVEEEVIALEMEVQASLDELESFESYVQEKLDLIR